MCVCVQAISVHLGQIKMIKYFLLIEMKMVYVADITSSKDLLYLLYRFYVLL